MKPRWRNFCHTARMLGRLAGLAFMAVIALSFGLFVNLVFTFMPVWMLAREFGILAPEITLLSSVSQLFGIGGRI